jgi:hypothetical protein
MAAMTSGIHVEKALVPSDVRRSGIASLPQQVPHRDYQSDASAQLTLTRHRDNRFRLYMHSLATVSCFCNSETLGARIRGRACQ